MSYDNHLEMDYEDRFYVYEDNPYWESDEEEPEYEEPEYEEPFSY